MTDPINFDRSLLSTREYEILELATEGLSDQEIAHRIQISPSTVSSYWVRIRGKLGNQSRTGLVANTVRQHSNEEFDRFIAETAEQNQAAQGERNSQDLQNEQLSALILRAMPEPVMALSQDGTILYVNAQFEALVGYQAVDIVGCPVETIVPPLKHSDGPFNLADCLSQPGITRLGSVRTVYAMKSDRQLFRVTVEIGSAETTEGMVFTCVVREHAEIPEFPLGDSLAAQDPPGSHP